MQRERPLARSFVAAAFWGDSSEAQARRNLNSHLYRLKTLLGSANYFCSERETIQFNPRAHAAYHKIYQSGDVSRFENQANGKGLGSDGGGGRDV
jgi:DNA-binding SARP family transcriptional activator